MYNDLVIIHRNFQVLDRALVFGEYNPAFCFITPQQVALALLTVLSDSLSNGPSMSQTSQHSVKMPPSFYGLCHTCIPMLTLTGLTNQRQYSAAAGMGGGKRKHPVKAVLAGTFHVILGNRRYLYLSHKVVSLVLLKSVSHTQLSMSKHGFTSRPKVARRNSMALLTVCARPLQYVTSAFFLCCHHMPRSELTFCPETRTDRLVPWHRLPPVRFHSQSCVTILCI